MTRDECVALVQQQLGFRTTLASEIVTNMQLAQILLEKEPNKPWFLVSEDTYTTTVADEERIELPSDFIEEVEDATFKYRPDDYPDTAEVDLFKNDYDQLRINFAEEEAGEPQAYAILGNYFRVFPLPDDAYQLRLIYYKQAALLTSNVENVWTLNAPHLLMGVAGLQIATALRDTAAQGAFREWVQIDRAAIANKNVAREMSNREMQVGGRHF